MARSIVKRSSVTNCLTHESWGIDISHGVESSAHSVDIEKMRRDSRQDSHLSVYLLSSLFQELIQWWYRYACRSVKCGQRDLEAFGCLNTRGPLQCSSSAIAGDGHPTAEQRLHVPGPEEHFFCGDTLHKSAWNRVFGAPPTLACDASRLGSSGATLASSQEPLSVLLLELALPLFCGLGTRLFSFRLFR
jgi:hypothetical protein